MLLLKARTESIDQSDSEAFIMLHIFLFQIKAVLLNLFIKDKHFHKHFKQHNRFQH